MYSEAEERVYINSEDYFTDVKPEVWNYHIGGYQVLHKYLKDRKGRRMSGGSSGDDPRRYCRIVMALKKTIEIQQEIDKLYPKVEENLIGREGDDS